MLERSATALIRFYQGAISPLTPAACRYRPTCSEYALGAVRTHGLLAGGWLAVRRVLRCHPFGGRGWDPVPPRPPEEDRAGDEPWTGASRASGESPILETDSPAERSEAHGQ